ncbi:hypothetical protein ACYUJ6_05980 [Clostridium sp. JNZ X4-2]
MASIILVAVGMILITLNLNALLKEKKSFKGQLNVKQNEMEDYKIEIGKIRKEFAETVFELQGEIESLKNENKNNMDKMILYDRSGKKVNKESNSEKPVSEINNEGSLKEHETEKVNTEDVNNIRIDEIRNLLHKNISVDEICKKTGIGKGEILLIKELYTR